MIINGLKWTCSHRSCQCTKQPCAHVCGNVNRPSELYCTRCGKRRWEQFNWTEHDVAALAKRIVDAGYRQ